MEDVIGKHKLSLDTPCLVIDKTRLLSNIKTMQDRVNSAQKNLRPHVKTHKCLTICKMQIEAGAIGICAAKVSEALILAKGGINSILITSPVVTETKINTLMTCVQYDTGLIVVVDNLLNAEQLNQIAYKNDVLVNVLIDIDPGVGRTGVPYSDVLNFAQALKKFENLKLWGIQCYAGNLQHVNSYQERCNASREVMQRASSCLQQLKQAGFNCKIFSGSGTGTYAIDVEIPDVTEVQPGSYTVMDAEYQPICDQTQAFAPALILLTTVISTNHHSHVTCDAGWKALYEVPTKPIVLKPQGFTYEWYGDEHGKIIPIGGTSLPKLGDKLELMVAHCDPTINMHDVFYITEDDIVTEVWPIEMRGKSQ